MKVETEIPIQATPERIWDILADFGAYADWNPYVRAVRGGVGPETEVEMDIAYLTGMTTSVSATERARVTAFAPPKYFSWVWDHPFGNWWLSAERVFRVRKRESDGKVFFHHETYFTGFSTVKVLGFLDFRRDALEQKVKLSMIRMNEALKERAEGIAPAP